ncbi:hypothetical protein, partial [Candidatus Collinsella stercoripullorum]|uniref:hypothetical protein n=1 Tax=Candidatus Collinsella stercoripullorum TaxID=2838522 RepID=UPI0022E161C6
AAVRRPGGRDGRAARGLIAAAVVIGAALAAVTVVVLVRALAGAVLDLDAREPVVSAEPAHQDGAVTVGAEEPGSASIVYGGSVYALRTDADGAAVMTRARADDPGASIDLFELDGDPAGFACFGGTLYAVSNVDAGFVVQAYVDADGSLPTRIASGEGVAAAVELDGSVLRLRDASDAELLSIDLADR